MLPYPDIDPVILRIGPLSVRWYGLMYLVGFVSSYFLVLRQLKEEGEGDIQAGQAFLERLAVYMVVGVVLGGRLGYVLFYNPAYYLEHPLEVLETWHGGMSFHGGLLGALAAGVLCCRLGGESFLKWADRLVVTAPVGLGLGRIANFINGELYGRPSQVPWAMIFPQGGLVPRHPSQLYEAIYEGVFLFFVLWPIRRVGLARGRLLGAFMALYGAGRFVLEFFREPDPQLGFVLWDWMTMGQVLCLLLVLAGAGLWLLAPASLTKGGHGDLTDER